MGILNRKDFWGGVLIFGLGLFTVVYAQRWELGTLSRMGPAFFPTCLGVVLCLFGGLLACRSLRVGEGIERPEYRAGFFVLLSILVFSFGIDRIGLVVTSLLSVFLAGMADRKASILGTIVLSTLITAICVLIFVVGLGMSVPIWWI